MFLPFHVLSFQVVDFLCCAKVYRFDEVPFVNFCFNLFCLGRLTYENIDTVYIKECLAHVIFWQFYDVMSNI